MFILVRVSRTISKKQFNYLYWWSTRSRYHNIIHRFSLSMYTFRLPPTALAYYAIARLREKLVTSGPRPIPLLDIYPVGSEGELPPAPRSLSKLFAKRKLTRQEVAWLEGIRLVPTFVQWGKWPRIPNCKKSKRKRLLKLG